MNAPNPIDLRDLIVDEPNGFVVDNAIRNLLDRSWPVPAILAEIPGISEADVRRVSATMPRRKSGAFWTAAA